MVHITRIAFPALVLVVGLDAGARAAATDTMVLVSAAPPPATGGGDAISRDPAVSASGRYVALSSTATNLVPNDLNQESDIFVRDLVTGTLTRQSLLTGGVEAVGPSYFPSISADGNIVVFMTTNALDGQLGGFGGVYARNRVTNTTTMVSVNAAGAPGIYGASAPTVSADGRYVVFQSNSPNLVPNDTNNACDIFLSDLVTGVLTRISLDPNGSEANGLSCAPHISSNGRWVLFVSSAANLDPADTTSGFDIYVLDRQNGAMTVESQSTAGAIGNGTSGGQYYAGGNIFDGGSISDDGRWVVFESIATNLVANDTNALSDVFLRDRQTGTTTRISLSYTGAQTNGDAHHARISADGRWIVYDSPSPDVVPGDTLGWTDVFVFDRIVGTTRLVSRSTTGGPGNFISFVPAISDDGHTIAFQSSAANLVPSDPNGGLPDVFAYDGGLAYPTYCAGDGSATACPCGNTGASGKGCDNSFSTGGAELNTSGFAQVSQDSLSLRVDGMPNTTTCLFLQGSAQVGGGQGVIFGDGLRCVAGTIVRLGSRIAAAGASAWGAPGSGDVPLSIRGGIPAGGGLVHYQVWYRNAAPFCGASSFNLSNGTSVTWLP